MPKLTGKAKAAARRKVRTTPRDPHVKHARCAMSNGKGEPHFLCGIPVERDDSYHRPARYSGEISCKPCKTVHKKMLHTPEGRVRLGLDKRVPAEVPG